MKKLKTILIILKNLGLIIGEEIVKMFTVPARWKWTAGIIIILALAGGGYKMWKYYHPSANDPNLTLDQAARIGSVTTHKLMVQIENRNCPPAIANGCYQRGDIVLIKDGNWQFSDAEKEGFLILHMDLTDKQAEVLVESLQQKAKNQPAPPASPELQRGEPAGLKDKGPDMPPQMETVKMRKYAVDLKKIGIGDDVTSGKEVDTVYKWDVVKEK